MNQEKSYVKNTADPKQVKAAGEKVKSDEDQWNLDMQFVLSSPQGRRVLWKYLSDAGVYHTSFTGNNTTFFNEGKREIGLAILHDIHEANAEAYILMMNENKKGDK